MVKPNTTLTFWWMDARFKLQSQTNSLANGLKTNWSDYPCGGSSPVGVTINPATPILSSFGEEREKNFLWNDYPG